MEAPKRRSVTLLEKLRRFLEPRPEEFSDMPIEEVREELREAGIDTRPLIAAIIKMAEGTGSKTDGQEEK